MNVKLLIDAIMQQTTVLIGQLSTAAGVRAPLSRVADRVFIELARELQAQGVGNRVAADMFGLALRSYQKKVRRLTQSESVPEQTLWEAVLRHVREQKQCSRRTIQRRFKADPDREVGAVLNDLVSSGLLYHTGQGADSLYGVTDEAALQRLAEEGAAELSIPRLWAAVHEHGPIERVALQQRLSLDQASFDAAVSALVDEGKLLVDGQQLRCADLIVPLGAEMGWEMAVLDHFRAVVNALSAKLRRGPSQASADDVVGGATLSFELYPGHPLEDRVRGLLRDVRARVNTLWDEVEAHNADHAAGRDDDELYRVYFYLGQYLAPDARDVEEDTP